MRTEIIEVYKAEENKPKHGEIVHLIGYSSNCVYYTDHREGFWFVDGTGEKAPLPKEWYRLL